MDVLNEVAAPEEVATGQSGVNHLAYRVLIYQGRDRDIGEYVRDNVLENADVPENELGEILVHDGLQDDELIEQVLVHEDLLAVAAQVLEHVVNVEPELAKSLQVAEL